MKINFLTSKITLIVILLFICTKSFCQDIRLANRNEIKPGINQTQRYFPELKNKKIAVIANQASTFINGTHLVDSLFNLGYQLNRIFCPEHGFRGKADAGAKVENGKDSKTGIPIISLYGKNKKPQQNDLKDLDLIIFDLQDVGVRFYTYISSLKYVMEACAEYNIKLIILDRPNPNGFYVDGPILKKDCQSFVGTLPIPIVYGLTIGELSLMIEGENWRENHYTDLNLKVINNSNYAHNLIYQLPIKPSPNLPNWQSVYLYPSLCLFEGTIISVGRGTPKPFQIFGHPKLSKLKNLNEYAKKISFVPKSTPGASLHPKLEDKLCYGYDLVNYANHYKSLPGKLNLEYLIKTYKYLKRDKNFFNKFIEKLVGDKKVVEELKRGKSSTQIKKLWQSELDKFKIKRQKYLMYP
ncbi:MAG: exo-beta-N-acetylmuramidase NamZ domain-containing protein [Bacteroidales bacterium]